MAGRRDWWAAWALGALAVTIAAGACSAPDQSMARSQALVAELKQKNIPGLPDPLTDEQAKEIDVARSGKGQWFVEKGCFACHSVSVYGVKSYTQMGPDLSTAVEDVQSRFGKNIDEFWREPVGTMMMVRSDLIKLTPEETALALEKLKAAFADYKAGTH
jgi:hypothetical protein